MEFRNEASACLSRREPLGPVPYVRWRAGSTVIYRGWLVSGSFEFPGLSPKAYVLPYELSDLLVHDGVFRHAEIDTVSCQARPWRRRDSAYSPSGRSGAHRSVSDCSNFSQCRIWTLLWIARSASWKNVPSASLRITAVSFMLPISRVHLSPGRKRPTHWMHQSP